MAQTSWPSPTHNSRNVDDAEYEKIHALAGDGVWGDPGDTAVVSAGSGLQVSVRSGVRAVVRGQSWYSGDDAFSLTIASNTSGSSRTDRIVLRLDRSAWTVRAVVKQGTPGSSAPSLSQSTANSSGTWEVALAKVTVANNASSVSVSREEQYIGSRVRPCTSSTRPPNPQRGEIIHETNTGKWYGWDGSAWALLYHDSGVVPVNGSSEPWSVNVDSVLQLRNGVVCMRLGAFDRTGGNLDGGTDSRLPVSIPSAYRHPNRDMHGIIYIAGAGAGAGRVTVYAANNGNGRAGEVWLTNHTGVLKNSSVTGSTISWVVD